MAAKFLVPGKKVKDRTVVLTGGEKKKLSELVGKKGMVLYFYPKDSTPGCTKEACNFRDFHREIQTAGYSVVGVSMDSVESHDRFTEKQSLNFPLISDPDRKLIEDCGVWQEKKNYGKTYMGVVRSTFVVDPGLKILRVYEKVKTTTHGADVLADLIEAG